MTSNLPNLEDIAAVFSQPLPGLAPVGFSDVEIAVEGVTAEYMEHDGKMKLHFFADGAFPANFGEALESIEMDGAFTEYVPEAKSWYFEYGLSPTAPPDMVLQLFMKKVAGLVNNAQGQG